MSTFALVIDERTPGQYFWSVVQPRAAGANEVVVASAMGPLATEIAAVVAGNAALKRIKAAGSEPAGSWAANFAETIPGQLS